MLKRAFLFKVPNDEEGNDFIAMCKKYLNKECWQLRARPRNSDRKSILGDSWQKDKENDISPSDAEYFGVYLAGKFINEAGKHTSKIQHPPENGRDINDYWEQQLQG